MSLKFRSALIDRDILTRLLCLLLYTQDALRKRKEEEDRVAQQNEFLNRSLRGSKKLRELEHEPPETGIVNDGFASEHDDDHTGAAATEEPQDPYEPIYRVVGESNIVSIIFFRGVFFFFLPVSWEGVYTRG